MRRTKPIIAAIFMFLVAFGTVQAAEFTQQELAYMPAVFRNEVLFARLTIEPAESTMPMGGIRTLELRVEAVEEMYGLGLVVGFTPDKLEVIDADPSAPGVQIEPGDFPDPGQSFVVENSVDNATGAVLLEKPGYPPVREVADDLASFITTLVPRPPVLHP